MNDDIVKLDTICEDYFGLSVNVANRKAALSLLPIPAFRLSGRKGPLFVRKADLAALVERRADEASRIQAKMVSVGAV
jgi:hypothetical protein